jgi:LPS O-antigen subunit length determinant protein (WzzB/FepE family)
MSETQRNAVSDDNVRDIDFEINMIDVFSILWKRKFWIIGITFAFAIGAYLTSISREPVYRIETVIIPSILRIEESGQHTYIDSPGNIKALIEAGTFNQKIIKKTNEKGENRIKKLRFQVEIPKNSTTIVVKYDTNNVPLGKNILLSLTAELRSQYQELVEYYKREVDIDIQNTVSSKVHEKTLIESQRSKLKEIERRISDLKKEIELISENTELLLSDRSKYLTANSEKDILLALLYTNTIQQNLSLFNQFRNELNEFISKREKEFYAYKLYEQNIKQLEEELDLLKYKKEAIQNIKIVQGPYADGILVSSNKKLIIIIFTFAGFIISVVSLLCIVIIKKYIWSYKNNAKSQMQKK